MNIRFLALNEAHKSQTYKHIITFAVVIVAAAVNVFGILSLERLTTFFFGLLTCNVKSVSQQQQQKHT